MSTLSGTVTGTGGVPVSGTYVYVFDAGDNYIGAATMGPGAAYTITLAAGSYKLYTQTNTPAYPDQWFGGTSFASATSVAVSGPTSQTIALVLRHTLSGTVTDGTTALGGASVEAFGPVDSGHATTASDGTWSIAGLGNGVYTIRYLKRGYSLKWSVATIAGGDVALGVFAITTGPTPALKHGQRP